jgi:hypothetical protein
MTEIFFPFLSSVLAFDPFQVEKDPLELRFFKYVPSVISFPYYILGQGARALFISQQVHGSLVSGSFIGSVSLFGSSRSTFFE